MMIQRQIENEIERQVADAINERDIEIINMINKLKAKHNFDGESFALASINLRKQAFDFACDEIIRLIDQSE